MAVRQVLKTNTFEQQRQIINSLGADVGDASALTTNSKILTTAINDIVSGSQYLVNGTFTGDVTIQGGDIHVENMATDIWIKDNVSNALSVREGSNRYISVDTIDNAELITLYKNTLIGGNLTVNGDITFRAGQGTSGSITLGDLNTDNISFGANVNSDVIPSTANQYNLGSLSKYWSSVFTSVVTSGTNGNVTIDPNGTGNFVFKGGASQKFSINDGTNEVFAVDSTTGNISAKNFSLVDNNATSLTFKEGANPYLTFDTTDGAEQVIIHKNLRVDGTVTTVNSTTVTIDDKNIELASVDSPTDDTADGGGITIKGASDKTFNWYKSTGAWQTNQPLIVQNNLKLSNGTLSSTNGTDVTITPASGKNVVIDTTSGFVVPKGTTTQRPLTPIATDGLIRFNTQTNQIEGFKNNDFVSISDQFKYGISAPSNSLGNNGDYYFDKVKQNFYGPKESGVWPTPICIKEDRVENVLYVSKSGSDTLYDGSTPAKAYKTIRAAAIAARSMTGNTTIKVASGDYYEENPIYLPRGTSLIGDNLRETIVRPLNDGLDMFWVTSGCYVAQIVLRDNYGDVLNSGDVGRGLGRLTSGINQYISKTTTTINLFPGHNLTYVGGKYKDGANILRYKRTDLINYAYAQLIAGYPSIVIPPTNFTGNLTNNNAVVVNISSTVGIQQGDVVTGTNIQSGTTVLSIDSSSQITLSKTATATVTNASLSVPGAGKCKRDLGLILDAVIHDLDNGGNVKSVLAGQAYRDANGNLQYITTDFVETKYAIEQLRLRARQYLIDNTIPAQAGYLALYPAVTVGDCSSVQTNLDNLFGIISSILDGADAPKINPGPGYILIDQEWIKIDSIANNVITVNTSGRGVANPITGESSVADYHPNGATITQGGRAFRYAVTYPDQSGILGKGRLTLVSSNPVVTGTNTNFTTSCFAGGSIKVGASSYSIFSVDSDTQLTLVTPPGVNVSASIYNFIPPKERVFLSPYIQNCSVISVLGRSYYDSSTGLYDVTKTRAGGLFIDGYQLYTDSPLKSMVCDAFTQVVFGSIGFHLKNDSYAQLVSVFEIFEDVGVLCETGGYASVTNSATNFGNIALKASGYSPKSLPFYANGRISAIVNITKTSFATSPSSILSTTFTSVLSGAKIGRAHV